MIEIRPLSKILVEVSGEDLRSGASDVLARYFVKKSRKGGILLISRECLTSLHKDMVRAGIAFTVFGERGEHLITRNGRVRDDLRDQ